MAWLDSAIVFLQKLTHQLDQLEHLAVLAFLTAVRVILIAGLVVWAMMKCWSLAYTLLVANS